MKFAAFVFIFLLCLLIHTTVNAVSMASLKKYPYVLLTKDYGILNEYDLGDFSWGFNRHLFNRKDPLGGNYWQCFPRQLIAIILEDSGSSSEDFGWRDNIAFLKIQVVVNPYLRHEYEMRAVFTITDYEKIFDLWRNLMKGEKYVCLAGDYVNYEHKIENGIERDIYGWLFEKIKTKKGCDSYFYSCHPTYEKYLKHKQKAGSCKFQGIGNNELNR